MNWRSFIFIVLGSLLISGCMQEQTHAPEKGISRKLAEFRKSVLSDITYNLNFTIPENAEKQVTGVVKLRFKLSGLDRPLAIDFQADSSNVLEVLKRGREPVDYRFVNEHIIIPRRYLQLDENRFTIRFISENPALNRRDDLMYTLFVPDKASTVFPCFDQPDLKARFKLQLTIPEQWKAVSNAPAIAEDVNKGTREVRFQQSGIIPTYLFSFAAGAFNTVKAKRGDHQMVLYHRNSNTKDVERNKEAVFDLVHRSLDFMKRYTGIAYPYKKYDLVAIPSFQYSGMEHPGATLYRSNKIFLSKEPTFNDKLDRAELIAHEVAHNWFGNYLTIEWFNEVWLKELFATFMADKMVARHYPKAQHNLIFFLSHIPESFALDRTAGAMPVARALDNLNGAGNLYDAIIYNKAPVIMRQLEMLTGKNDMQHGLQQYLKENAYGNASWNALISILSPYTNNHLKKWSDEWMLQEGIPRITTDIEVDDNSRILALRLQQRDASGKNRMWQQNLQTGLHYKNRNRMMDVVTNSPVTKMPKAKGMQAPLAVFPDVSGLAYGYFPLNDNHRSYLLDSLHKIDHTLMRAQGWVTLNEETLHGNVQPQKLLQLAVKAIKEETNELILSQVMDYTMDLYWQFVTDEKREAIYRELEPALWERINNTSKPSLQSGLIGRYIAMASNRKAADKLVQLYNEQFSFYQPGNTEANNILLQLKLLDDQRAEKLIKEKMQATEDAFKRKKLNFILPALSNEKARRDSFFHKLRYAENRANEQWVTKGLKYLNHPLNNGEPVGYLKDALKLLPEVASTGNVFFTEDWLNANLAWHNSDKAVQIINTYLAENPDMPTILRNKVKQEADLVFRANQSLTHNNH